MLHSRVEPSVFAVGYVMLAADNLLGVIGDGCPVPRRRPFSRSPKPPKDRCLFDPGHGETGSAVAGPGIRFRWPAGAAANSKTGGTWNCAAK
jgi:hypothetical protein